jgi:hypothetical protein
MIPLFDPKLLAENLAIIFIFTLFTLRAFWNAFVNKTDPINAIKLSWLERKLKNAEVKQKLDNIS